MSWIAKSVAWLGLILSWVLTHSPKVVRNTIGSFLGVLWYDVFRIRRSVVLSNLQLAFPEMQRKDKIRLGRRSVMNLGKNLVEYCYLPFLSRGNFRDVFAMEGTELLDQAEKEGHGALLMTLHMGHGDLAAVSLAYAGYRVFMVSKFFSLRWLNDLWFGMRRKSGMEFIPPRNSSFTLLKALKTNALVILPLDQFTGPPIGVRTKFFGHETGTAAGLAIMAERAKSPVIACYSYRADNGKHVLVFKERIDVHFGEDRDADIVEYTQRFNDLLEGFVRKHPDQWMWIHKRWKTFEAT
jgi:KDO2-lipid IV(A) lauroyltransferase